MAYLAFLSVIILAVGIYLGYHKICKKPDHSEPRPDPYFELDPAVVTTDPADASVNAADTAPSRIRITNGDVLSEIP